MTPNIGPYLLRLFFEIGMSQKGCSGTCNIPMAYCPNKLKEKWETVLNEELSYDIIENVFKELTNIKLGAILNIFNLNYYITAQLPMINYTI